MKPSIRRDHSGRPARWAHLALAAIIALGAILTGCALTATSVPTAQPSAQPTEAPPAIVAITDTRGQEVQVPANVQRIVSLAPAHTEILYALGLGDKVVGVTTFCTYPPEAQEVDKVGDLSGINVELIATLAPDLVLAIDGLEEPVAQLERLGIAVLVIQPSDLESIYATIRTIGAAAGAAAEADALVASMQQRVADVEARVAAVDVRPSVFYEIDATDPAKPYTVGPGSWHDQFITLAGGRNIAGDAAMAWVQISTEEIITEDPDVIILGDANYGVSPDDVKARPGWEVLSAVQADAVYAIDDDLISRPGPRVVEGIEALAAILHPELFP